MRARFVALTCSAFIWLPAAHAAPADLAEFQACHTKSMVCYEYVAQIRSTQLASERERIFVEREKIVLADWQAHRDHRLHALWSQYIQTWILLGIGIIVVGAGLSMSWMHMANGLRDGLNADSAMEVGKDGIRLSSPVIGLFVFGASIWFFTVYIDKVYFLSLLPSETTATGGTNARQSDDKTADEARVDKESTAAPREQLPPIEKDARKKASMNAAR